MSFIGLTGPSSFTPQCVEMIEEYFGATPVLLYANTQPHLETLVGMCSGVVLAGGLDIHPSIYGEPLRIGQGLSGFDLARDAREIAIIGMCLDKIPILGICRGHQLLGALSGCGIRMDLAGYYAAHSPAKAGIEADVAHKVELTPGGGDTLLGESILWVNSYHHQGVVSAPEDIRVLGVTPDPKLPDVIELMDCPQWIGVQWHPEIDYTTNSASSGVLDMFAKLL